jgi:hypothetical protein
LDFLKHLFISPAHAQTMVGLAFEQKSILAGWFSLSLGAWLPSAALR